MRARLETITRRRRVVGPQDPPRRCASSRVRQIMNHGRGVDQSRRRSCGEPQHSPQPQKPARHIVRAKRGSGQARFGPSGVQAKRGSRSIDCNLSKPASGLTDNSLPLPGLESPVGLIDDEQPPAPAHNAAIAMTIAQRLDRILDLHLPDPLYISDPLYI